MGKQHTFKFSPHRIVQPALYAYSSWTSPSFDMYSTIKSKFTFMGKGLQPTYKVTMDFKMMLNAEMING